MVPKTAARLVGFLGGVATGVLLATASNTIIALSERTEAVFVYGTLRHPLYRWYGCRCFVASEPATLPGWRATGRTITEDPAATTSGEGIVVSLTELQRLDWYEHVPTRYTRKRVIIDNQPHWLYRQTE